MPNYEHCKLVAEACCNHMGDFETAKRMVETAKICGADFVKFQKRTSSSIPSEIQNKPHPNPVNAFGETYLEHRENLEFTSKQHNELKKLCEKIDIGYSSSVWDIESAKEIIDLDPKYLKIPSAMNSNYELLEYVYGNFAGDIHLSLGMATPKEKERLLLHLTSYKSRTVIYWTTSGYPVNFEQLFLLEIEKLKSEFPHVGYSGHSLGIAADIAALTLGATWIERHFTLDRTWKGSDQAASLEPHGLQNLARDLKAVQKALSYKYVDLTEQELYNRKKLRIETEPKYMGKLHSI